MTDEIKDLLGKALSGEPPMGIDRDEVLDAGRKRLRRRRSLAAGGVAAAVVVAAVGAATLTGLIDVDPVENMPPAATRTETALPPGLDLPLPETPDPPLPTSTHGPAATPDHADELTQRLYQSGLLSADSLRPPGQDKGTPGFAARGDLYRFEADIVTPHHTGSLQLTVEPNRQKLVADCGDIVEPFDGCYSQFHDGIAVVFGSWKNSEGERRYLAVTVLPNGARVAAISSNVTFEQELSRPPDFGEPAIDHGELAKLIVLSNFHAG